jgi:3-dehydroquinate synthetase
MAGAARLSKFILTSSNDLIVFTEALLQDFQLPFSLPHFLCEHCLLKIMKRDKKVSRGEYTFVLSPWIGKADLIRGIKEEHVRIVLQEMVK